ncbi:glycosyltransferase family 4 protein [Spirosoma endbachense]|uniref:Glycosyltransferase n=1 Tax=Spirosoma endbachense TaxID=2666025 RepID=A0A6P1W489_9BACT|nr:glycosyltransferase family 4 protein [Spirosoma endbachense]QHV99704.1 glycosyltransferase [Spirosoma endbachense]
MHIMMSADWFYPSQMGGPSNGIYWQAKAMRQAGRQVTVVATSQDLPPTVPIDRWLEMDCGQVIYTKNPHFYLPFKHIWYAIGAIRKADVAHINSLFYPSSVLLVMAAQLLGKRIIWAPHGELSPSALSYRPRLKRLLLRLFRSISKGIVFHSTSLAETDHIRKHFGPNAAISEIENMMEMPPVVERKARNYLLFIGRLHPIKAIDHLIKALSESVIFRRSDFVLTIAGPDSDGYLQHLKTLAKSVNLAEKINFVGPVWGTEKEQLYADARITILPSHAENFGNVVIESLAQGTPVVASTGTPWQLLESEQAGSWVANTPNELRQVIEYYIQMPSETYHFYRKQATELAHRRFDIYANVAKWERFYEEVAR